MVVKARVCIGSAIIFIREHCPLKTGQVLRGLKKLCSGGFGQDMIYTHLCPEPKAATREPMGGCGNANWWLWLPCGIRWRRVGRPDTCLVGPLASRRCWGAVPVRGVSTGADVRVNSAGFLSQALWRERWVALTRLCPYHLSILPGRRPTSCCKGTRLCDASWWGTDLSIGWTLVSPCWPAALETWLQTWKRGKKPIQEHWILLPLS